MANYDFTYTGAEIQHILDTAKKLKDSGYIFLGVATPSTNPGTPTQKVYYEAKQAGTYTNFGGAVLPDGISLLLWNGSWTSETVMSGDGGVFDISVYKSSGGTLATYADLSAALDGGNNIPASARKGGMSVKFVQSSDNNYIQARCMAQNFTTDVTYWQVVDDEPTPNSNNLVKSGGVAAEFNSMDLVDTEKTEVTEYTGQDLSLGYIQTDGTWKSNSTFRCAIFNVNEGDVITCDGDGILRHVCAYNGNTAIPESGTTGVTTYIVPSGITKVAASIKIDVVNPPTKIIQTGEVIIKLPQQVITNKENIEENTENINEIDETLNFVDYQDTDYEDYEPYSIGYVRKDGTWRSNSTFKYGSINVNEGDVITAVDNVIRYVCAYNGNTVLAQYGYDGVYLSSYTVPAGVNKVNISSTSSVEIFRKTYPVTKKLPSQVLENMQNIEELNKENNDLFLNLIKVPFVIGWAEEGFYALGRAIASRRLGLELSGASFVNEKLFESDAYGNTAGYCIYDNGYIYVLKYQNHVSDGSNGEPEYSDLAKIDISTGNIVSRLKLFNDVDIIFEGGEAYHCGRIYCNCFTVGEKIKIIGSSAISPINNPSDTNTVICATINKTTLEVEKYNKCYITENGITELWQKDARIDPLITQVSVKNEYIYGVCNTVASKKWAIVRSVDFISFEVVAYLPDNKKLNSYGECGIDVNGNYCHVSCRISPFSGELGYVQASSASAIILKYDMRNWKLIKTVKVMSGMSMTTFFRHSSNLYAIVCGVYNQRSYYRFIKIDEDYLENSKVIADENGNLIGANTSLCSDGTYLYGCKTDVNLVIKKFHLPSFTRQEADTISDFLISQLT